MDLREYQKHAKRTMNWKLDTHIQLASMALGIAGELGEVLEITHSSDEYTKARGQVIDECGDVFWYVANICSVLSLEWIDLFPKTIMHDRLGKAERSVTLHAAKLADAVKKTIAQGHVLDIENVVGSIQGILAGLNSILAYYDLKPQEVCAYNQIKLMRRYPNGFESERSVKRD